VDVPDRCCKLNCSLCSPRTAGYAAGFDLRVMLCVGSTFCDSCVQAVACSSVVTLLRAATRLDILPDFALGGAVYCWIQIWWLACTCKFCFKWFGFVVCSPNRVFLYKSPISGFELLVHLHLPVLVMVCDLLTYFLCNVALVYELIWYFFKKNGIPGAV
jgi:hypothetical protein